MLLLRVSMRRREGRREVQQEAAGRLRVMEQKIARRTERWCSSVVRKSCSARCTASA